MKNNLLLFVLFSAFALTTNAQVSKGITIQGIARDNVGVAKDNTEIALRFTIYYGILSPATTIISQSKTLTTDAKGVFSTIIDVAEDEKILIANAVTSLKIEDIGDGTAAQLKPVSDALLQPVPYAISAYNGMPTGAVTPFLGATAPAGWLLCDGNPIPAKHTDLIALLGSNNTPDLRGQFLSGAGGPSNHALNTVIPQETPAHSHDMSIADHNIPAHSHNIAGDTEAASVKTHAVNAVHDDYGLKFLSPIDADQTTTELKNKYNILDKKFQTGAVAAVDLSHGTNPKTGSSGTGSVVRPESYAVTYIIKL
jgi:microcystin-dependent protein